MAQHGQTLEEAVGAERRSSTFRVKCVGPLLACYVQRSWVGLLLMSLSISQVCQVLARWRGSTSDTLLSSATPLPSRGAGGSSGEGLERN